MPQLKGHSGNLVLQLYCKCHCTTLTNYVLHNSKTSNTFSTLGAAILTDQSRNTRTVTYVSSLGGRHKFYEYIYLMDHSYGARFQLWVLLFTTMLFQLTVQCTVYGNCIFLYESPVYFSDFTASCSLHSSRRMKFSLVYRITNSIPDRC